MGILSFLGPMLFFIPAMAARVAIPELMDKPGGTAEAYVAISLKVLPIGIMGLMIAGMFSATLSTLGNEYNVLSGVLTKDFYARKINPEASEKQLIMWGKINTALIGGLTILFAIGINYVRGFNLWDIMNKAFGAFGPAIMLPLIGGLFIRKMNSRGALAGIITGMISGLTLVIANVILLKVYSAQVAADPQVSYWLKQGYNSISIIINISVTLSAMWIGSVTGNVSDEETTRAEAFVARMKVSSDAPVTRAAGEAQSPFMAVGVALMIFGALFLPIGLIIGGRGMLVDLIAGCGMMTLGFFLWLPNRAKALKSAPVADSQR
jgi:Na+/proline symporter